MPKISIIIPVYNASKTIERCVKSIRAQSFNDFEAIFIDDGSTDNSFAICDKFVKEDHRLIVERKPNGGVSSARNAGLSKAVGDWIAFADSDDTLDVDYLKDLYEASLSLRGIDLVLSGYKCIYPNKSVREYIFTGGAMSPKEVLTRKRFYRYGFPFGKLYKREILNKYEIKFDTSISMAEDMLFMFETLYRSKNVFISEVCKYNYYFYPDSLSKKYWDYDSELKLFCYTKKWMKKIGGEYTEDMYSFIRIYLMRAIYSMYRPKYGMSRDKRLGILKEIYSKNVDLINKTASNSIFLYMLKKQYIAFADTMFVVLFLLRYGMLKFLWNFRIKYKIKKQKSEKITI